MMGFAEFIIGPAKGRTRWLYPSYKFPASRFLFLHAGMIVLHSHMA